jgi:hypothetical protein
VSRGSVKGHSLIALTTDDSGTSAVGRSMSTAPRDRPRLFAGLPRPGGTDPSLRRFLAHSAGVTGTDRRRIGVLMMISQVKARKHRPLVGNAGRLVAQGG